MRLAFLARAGAPALATALAKSDGCGGVLLVVGPGQPGMTGVKPGMTGARNETALGWGPASAEKALAISGMHWKLFGYLPR